MRVSPPSTHAVLCFQLTAFLTTGPPFQIITEPDCNLQSVRGKSPKSSLSLPSRTPGTSEMMCALHRLLKASSPSQVAVRVCWYPHPGLYSLLRDRASYYTLFPVLLSSLPLKTRVSQPSVEQRLPVLPCPVLSRPRPVLRVLFFLPRSCEEDVSKSLLASCHHYHRLISRFICCPCSAPRVSAISVVHSKK